MADRPNARAHHVMHRVDASSTATVIMKCIFQLDMQISYAFCISLSRRGKKSLTYFHDASHSVHSETTGPLLEALNVT